jgi:raffinose/stachyose/melibiose transport system permease protein
MVSAAFKTQDEFFRNGLSLIPESFNLENIKRAWGAGNFNQYFFNSIVITATVVLIVLVTSSTAGYVIGRYSFTGKKLIVGVFVASMTIPLGFTIIPIYELIRMLHLDNTILGIILAEAGGAHVIFILLFSSFFRQIPNEMEEAAKMDGCGFVRTFIQIMLPLSKPIIGTVVIMQSIWTWNSFLLPLVLSLGNPKLRTLSVGLYALKGENVVDWTGISAGATIAIIPIIIVFLSLQKYFVDGIAGAVKS